MAIVEFIFVTFVYGVVGASVFFALISSWKFLQDIGFLKKKTK